MIFLWKHISLYALGRLMWILDIIWSLNQHFNLKNLRNWIKQVLMIKFCSGINCILLHWPKKLTLVARSCTCGGCRFFTTICITYYVFTSSLMPMSNYQANNDKVSFFGQGSKMQLIPLQNFIIKTCFIQFLCSCRLECWFKGQIMYRIDLSQGLFTA